jgi:hypothetical protein
MPITESRTSSATERIRICSEALTLVNASVISSFEDNTRGAQMASLHYERIYQYSLCRARWSFSRVLGELAADADYDGKNQPFNFRFPLPSDCVNLIGVLYPNQQNCTFNSRFSGFFPIQFGRLDNYQCTYRLMDGFIYVNAPTIVADYQYRVPEDLLKSYPLFRNFLVYSLAAEFASSVMNDDQKNAIMRGSAEESYSIASSTDTNSNPMEATNYSSILARMKIWG